MTWAAALTTADVADFFADIDGLNARVFQAYTRLMLRLRRYGPVPFDDHVLADVARVGRKSWNDRVWPALVHLFDIEDGYLCHPDIEGARVVLASPTARQVSASHAARTRHERERERRRQQLSLITGDAAQAAERTAGHAPRTAEPPPAHALRSAEEGSPHDQNAAISMRVAEIFRAETGAAHAERSAEAPPAQARAVPARTHAHTPLSSDSEESGESSGECESERGSGGEAAAAAAQAAQPAQRHAETAAQPAETPAEVAAQDPAQSRTFEAPRVSRTPESGALAPIPPDWQPSERDRREALRRGYDPDEAAERFRDTYLANGGLSPNWSARWRQYVREGIRGLERRPSAQRGLVMPIAGGSAPADTAAQDRATAAWVAEAEGWAANTPHAAAWGRVRAVMRADVSEGDYRAWLAPMALTGASDDAVTIGLPTRFLCDFARKRFGDRLAALWRAETPAADRIDFVVQERTERAAAASERSRAPPGAATG